MMELKVNNKAKTFSGTLGISEKRWDELTEACQIGSIKNKNDTGSDSICTQGSKN